MIAADFGNGDVLLWFVEFFLFLIYFWLLVIVVGDLFRDHEISGWAKALWVLFNLGGGGRGDGDREEEEKGRERGARHRGSGSGAEEIERDGLARAEHARARPSRDHPSPFPQARERSGTAGEG